MFPDDYSNDLRARPCLNYSAWGVQTPEWYAGSMVEPYTERIQIC